MKAVSISTFGGVEVLELGAWPDPVAGPGQVVVELRAASINPRDWMMRSGRYVFKRLLPPLPFVLGSDLAGVVASVGKGVQGFEPGDPVAAMVPTRDGFGAYAERASVRASALARVPERVGFLEAGALPLAGMTALQALRDRGRLSAGERVVVVGASGGVGHYAVQLARLLGAGEVIGVCSARNAELARELGCDRVIDYREQAFQDAVQDADLIFDAMGIASFVSASRALSRRGRYVTTVPNGRVLWDVARTGLLPFGRRASIVLVRSKARDLELLLRFMAEGCLRSVIDRVEPLENVAKLHEHSRSFRTRGKNMIRLGRSG